MSTERPTATILPSRTANASATVECWSSVMILPLTRAVSGDCAATGGAKGRKAKRAARYRPATPRHADRHIVLSSLTIAEHYRPPRATTRGRPRHKRPLARDLL